MNLAIESVSTLLSHHHRQQAKQPLVLTDCGLGGLGAIKFNHTRSARAAITLVLNFCTFNLANRGKQINQVFVASRPRKLIEILLAAYLQINMF